MCRKHPAEHLAENIFGDGRLLLLLDYVQSPEGEKHRYLFAGRSCSVGNDERGQRFIQVITEYDQCLVIGIILHACVEGCLFLFADGGGNDSVLVFQRNQFGTCHFAPRGDIFTERLVGSGYLELLAGFQCFVILFQLHYGTRAHQSASIYLQCGDSGTFTVCTFR